MKTLLHTALPDHPCMNDKAHGRVARIHLPVAPRCTVSCGYCERKTGVGEDSGIFRGKPGTCGKIMSPDEAVAEAAGFLDEWGRNSIVGIAGPGDPLANRETFDTLEKLHRRIPDARLCLCTNGLHLPESLEHLKSVNLGFLTVTVNAVSNGILEKIYSRVDTGDLHLDGSSALAVLNRNQMDGIKKAAELGICVKVNMVVIPGINHTHVIEVARTVSELGARVMNLMPLIPGGRLRDIPAPSRAMMNDLFDQCEPYIRVFRSCRQCRADARGIPGKDGCTWKKTA